MNLTVEEIVKITRGTLRAGSAQLPVTGVLTDSRKAGAFHQAMFVAITGRNHDGHRFLKEVYEKGVRVFVVQKEISAGPLAGAAVIHVADALTALQELAAWHRRQFTYPVIAITGSNGKTVVKEWLNQLLADDHRIVRSPRSYNSQLGVALSVLSMEPTHTLALFEAGISQPGEMDRLSAMLKPDLAVLTNIGEAHRENFSSREQLVAEKMRLFQGAGTCILSAAFRSFLPAAQHAVTWSADGPADVEVHEIRRSGSFTEISGAWKTQPLRFVLPYVDDASVENGLTCITVMLHLGYAVTVIQQRLELLRPVSMRLEVVNGNRGLTLINDTYSNDIPSLSIALDFMQQHGKGRPSVVVLSDVLQSGLEGRALCTQLNALLATRADRLIAVGAELSRHRGAFTLPTDFFPDTAALLASGILSGLAHAVVLVKGARVFGFENVVAFLQEKTHETVLEVNLNALVANLNYFRGKLNPGVRTMVMVKAFGYGSGMHEVASLLEFNKVDYLAVAYADEGVELRGRGISLPIMVMNPETSAMQAILNHNLEPEIYSLRRLREFVEHSRSFEGKTFNIHLKMDTGMHRLGFEEGHLSDALHLLQGAPHLRVASAFTHLAASENPVHDTFTRRQLSAFDAMCAQAEAALGYPFVRHALNTGGIQRFPDAQYGMVRLGIGLYGVAPWPEDQAFLAPVVALKSVVSQVKSLNAGDSVGYNRSFVAQHAMQTATIPLGYADGLRRTLSNGAGEVTIRGKRCPVVGNVCMDMTMVDVTGLEVKEGDAVLVFGTSPTLHEFARSSGTIEYEVLTAIGQRVKRIYIGE